MNYADVLLHSAARSVLAALIAVFPAAAVIQILRSLHKVPGPRTLVSLCALVPLFVPDLLTGFTYRLSVARFAGMGWPTELAYGRLAVCRCVAVIVAAWLVLGENRDTRRSLHSLRLLKSRYTTFAYRWAVVRLMLHGPCLPYVVGITVGCLLNFQEFETAALLQIDRYYPVSWPVWLFDAHAAGEPAATTLRLIAVPAACELFLILLLFRQLSSVSDSLAGDDAAHRLSPSDTGSGSFVVRILGMVWISASCLLTFVWPVCSLVPEAIIGLRTLSGSGTVFRRLAEPVLISLGFAWAGGLIAMLLADILLTVRRTILTAVLLLPGLAGSLVTGMVLLLFFRLPGIRLVYDTWLPMLLGLALTVLPAALLLSFVLRAAYSPHAVRSAELLAHAPDRKRERFAAGLIHRLRTTGFLTATAVTASFCFWNVTIASALHSPAWEPVITRLYNEMHYSRTEALALLTFVSLTAVPVTLAVALIVARRIPRAFR